MKTRWLGWISFVTLISVTLWLILLIWDIATAGPLETFQQVFAHAQKGDWKFTFNYLNAGIFTTCVIALMGGLSVFCRPTIPEWSFVGLVFVPIYGTLNLFAYLSQITLVPALIQGASDPVIADTVLYLLNHTLQLLPESTVGFFNSLAYAILGIPSILFGGALTQGKKPSLQITGWLLMMNGFACILGVIGISIRSDFLSMGTILGGAIFWLSLFPMTYAFFGGQDE